MRSHYKKFGSYIREVNIRNGDLLDIPLLGVSIQKILIPSIANIIGTDMATYKIIKKEQFAYGPVTSRNGDKISVALCEYNEGMVSQAYVVFEILDHEELDPEYLMMWFRRPEFDRYARFKSHGSAREIFDWNELCEIELPIPSIEKQREIVKEYHTIVNRIKLNQQLNQKLEETAQALYKQWFVDFEFPDENGKPYKSNGGEMIWCEEVRQEIPKYWHHKTIRDLVVINYGKTLSEQNRKPGTVKVYSSAGITGYHDTKLYNEKSILIGRKGSIGTLYLEDDGCFCIDTAYYIKESESLVPLLFIYRILKQLDLPSLNEDSAVPGLSRNTVYQKGVILPEFSVLTKYSNFSIVLNSRLTSLKKQIDILKKLQNILFTKMSKPELLETEQPA